MLLISTTMYKINSTRRNIPIQVLELSTLKQDHTSPTYRSWTLLSRRRMLRTKKAMISQDFNVTKMTKVTEIDEAEEYEKVSKQI